MTQTLPRMWEEFIRERVASGQYADEMEVIKEALRLLEKRDSQLDDLRRAVREGEESGEPVPFDPEDIKRRGRERLKQTS